MLRVLVPFAIKFRNSGFSEVLLKSERGHNKKRGINTPLFWFPSSLPSFPFCLFPPVIDLLTGGATSGPCCLELKTRMITLHRHRATPRWPACFPVLAGACQFWVSGSLTGPVVCAPGSLARRRWSQFRHFQSARFCLFLWLKVRPIDTNPNPKVRKRGAVGKAVLAQDPGFDGAKSCFLKQNK